MMLKFFQCIVEFALLTFYSLHLFCTLLHWVGGRAGIDIQNALNFIIPVAGIPFYIGPGSIASQ